MTVAEQQAEAEQLVNAIYDRYGIILELLILAPTEGHDEDDD